MKLFNSVEFVIAFFVCCTFECPFLADVSCIETFIKNWNGEQIRNNLKLIIFIFCFIFIFNFQEINLKLVLAVLSSSDNSRYKSLTLKDQFTSRNFP